MKLLHALGSGIAGAVLLTTLHEITRRMIPDAPRMDLLGMRAIAKTMRKADQDPPPADELHRLALVGDIFSNSLYYSLVGLVSESKQALIAGPLLGLAAGLGALALPGPLGLGEDASNRTPRTRLLTVLLYLFGGLASAGVYRAIRRSAD